MTGTSGPKLISVDWGTTSLRCSLLAVDGAVLAHAKSPQGILKTNGAAFGDILFKQIEPWLSEFANGTTVPVVMSGMIGSRQGWQEATYVRCPATPDELASKLLKVETAGTRLAGCDVRIVPGMDIPGNDEFGQMPDVMRGEETQVFGAMLGTRLTQGVFVLPGTHSKWVTVGDGEINGFETYMTGEVYAALLDATIIGRLAEGDHYDHDSFAAGAKMAIIADDESGGPGHLLNLIFSARTRVLAGDMAPAAVRSYLSGVLIGAEVMAGLTTAALILEENKSGEHIFILAEEPLLSRYKCVAEIAGAAVTVVDGNSVVTAHLAIAQHAGMVK